MSSLLERISAATNAWATAAEGDSGDAEHEAALVMYEVLEEIAGFLEGSVRA